MNRKIFVNLPVKDLKKSMDFFAALGFTFNKQFTDETAACMVISEDIYTMLLTHEKWNSLIPIEICDRKHGSEVAVCLSCKDRQEVEETVRKALAAGGTRYNESKDYGFMFQDGFLDPDGHIWELIYMDPSFVQKS